MGIKSMFFRERAHIVVVLVVLVLQDSRYYQTHLHHWRTVAVELQPELELRPELPPLLAPLRPRICCWSVVVVVVVVVVVY